MQKVFSVGKMPDAPVGGLFFLQDSSLRPERVCGFPKGVPLQIGPGAAFLTGGNAPHIQEASA